MRARVPRQASLALRHPALPHTEALLRVKAQGPCAGPWSSTRGTEERAPSPRPSGGLAPPPVDDKPPFDRTCAGTISGEPSPVPTFVPRTPDRPRQTRFWGIRVPSMGRGRTKMLGWQAANWTSISRTSLFLASHPRNASTPLFVAPR